MYRPLSIGSKDISQSPSSLLVETNKSAPKLVVDHPLFDILDRPSSITNPIVKHRDPEHSSGFVGNKVSVEELGGGTNKDLVETRRKWKRPIINSYGGGVSLVMGEDVGLTQIGALMSNRDSFWVGR